MYLRIRYIYICDTIRRDNNTLYIFRSDNFDQSTRHKAMRKGPDMCDALETRLDTCLTLIKHIFYCNFANNEN